MSFRLVNLDIMLRGTILATVQYLFPAGVPSLGEYARDCGVAPSTFRRASDWLLGLLPGLLHSRRPGPQPEEPSGEDERETALGKLRDLCLWLREVRSETAKNNCYSGEAKQRIKSVAEEIHSQGLLTFAEIASELGLSERQLLRMRQEVEKSRGAAPEPGSRRPQRTSELAGEIQRLIADIERSADSRNPYRPTDVKRILQKNYKKELLEYHGSETISLGTVSKYMTRSAEKKTESKKEAHPRGNYRYPEPFQQVALDTSHFELYGRVFYLIAVFELGGRLNLLTRVFLRESVTEVVEVTEEFLDRYPQVEVALMDRGTPYLNEKVKRVIESRGKLRLVAPAATPEAKAAAERHFRTVKEAIRPAILSVFPQDPGWRPEHFGKVVQVAVEVFRQLYPRIPQEGIDGKCPWERASSFDPLRAAESRLELYDRALNSEPTEQYARELHRRFQLPGSEEDTVNRLRQYGTRALRTAAEQVAPYMGPPQPVWMYDPLGYLAAKAREVLQKEKQVFAQKKFLQEREKQQREEARAHTRELEQEAQAYDQHPERFVDQALRTLMVSLDCGLGIARSTEDLKTLLGSLSRRFGSAFSTEVSRLKERIQFFFEDPELRLRAERLFDGLVRGLSP